MSYSVTSRGLPGIGICQELELQDGSRLGVVTRRSGKRDLLVYDAEDPDAASARVILTENEAHVIAELLGGPQIITQLAALNDADGLVVEQLPLHPESPYVGRPLGATRARTLTGASVVAILRDAVAIPSPGPEFTLAAGDLIAVVGTQPAIDQLTAILDGSDASPPTDTHHPG
jgi:TrkA domain protein